MTAATAACNWLTLSWFWSLTNPSPFFDLLIDQNAKLLKPSCGKRQQQTDMLASCLTASSRCPARHCPGTAQWLFKGTINGPCVNGTIHARIHLVPIAWWSPAQWWLPPLASSFDFRASETNIDLHLTLRPSTMWNLFFAVYEYDTRNGRTCAIFCWLEQWCGNTFRLVC